jgi:OOP family OmpA-OmpF porin
VTGEKILIKEVVQFRVGSAVILPESFELLDQVAQAIKEYEIKKVRVEGHASSDGNDQKNLVLSQQRADSVRQYLISKGIPEDALIAKGFGETQPIASNNTAEGRKMNRRVEFVVLDEK